MRTIAATILAIATLYLIVWELMSFGVVTPHDLGDPRHPPSTIGAPSPLPVPNR